jgi:hypothetical protein
MLISSQCIDFQLSSIVFQHKHRLLRLKKVINILFQSNPSFSFPQIFKDQHQLKGFYRLINNKVVSNSTFVNGYQSGLIKYSKEQKSNLPWILFKI